MSIGKTTGKVGELSKGNSIGEQDICKTTYKKVKKMEQAFS
jgi:hypothetical protein